MAGSRESSSGSRNPRLLLRLVAKGAPEEVVREARKLLEDETRLEEEMLGRKYQISAGTPTPCL